MNGTHFIVMFRFMTDEPPAEVTGWIMPDTLPNPRGPEFEDRGGAMRVVTPSGKRLYLDLGPDQGHGVLFIVYGRNGHIVVDPIDGRLILSAREEQHRGSPTLRYNLPGMRTEHRITTSPDGVEPARRTLEALLKQTNPPTGEEGRQALEVLIAAYVSHENGNRTVRLGQTDLPRDRTFPWA